MKNHTTAASLLTAVAVTSAALCGQARAHGPVVVLTKDASGTIVTNQLDVTPMSDSASTADYPVGTPSRTFPSNYNASDFASFSTSAYVANTPTNLGAIPMTLVTSGSYPSNTGYYGQLEATDAEGNATLNTGPGYAYGNGGFANGTLFQIVFAGALQYWNGSTFTATPDGEQLQAIRSTNAGAVYANTLTSNGVQGGTGLQVSVSASQNAGSHSQLSYRLMDASGDSTDTAGIDNGLYLASFEVETASTSGTQYGTSLPYYMLFDMNDTSGSRSGMPAVTSAQITAANNYINSTLVPEPASLSLIAASGLLLGRRRRNA
jgi:hypothetical protein